MTTGVVSQGQRVAGRGLLTLIAILSVYHILLLSGMLPPVAAWGGRVAELPANLQTLELFALGILLFFSLLILGHLRRWGGRFAWLFRVGCGVIAAYFSLNVVLNLMALGLLERLLFTPLSFMMAVFAWWLVLARS